MNRRKLGKTGFDISEVSLGTWQVGGTWGSGFDDANADSILNAAIDSGINFCLLYTSPSPRDRQKSRMPSSA